MNYGRLKCGADWQVTAHELAPLALYVINVELTFGRIIPPLQRCPLHLYNPLLVVLVIIDEGDTASEYLLQPATLIEFCVDQNQYRLIG